MKKLFTRVTGYLVICLSLLPVPGLLQAQEAESTVDLAVSENFIMKTTGVLARLMVDNPEIATVKVLGSRELLISALKIGATTVRFRDDNGKEERIAVIVEAESSAQQQVRALIAAIAPQDKISFQITREAEKKDNAAPSASAVPGQIVLSGAVPTASRGNRLEQALASLGYKVINLLAVRGSQQVQLSVRVAEVVKGNPMAAGVAFRDKQDRYGLFPPGNLGTTANFLLNVDEIVSGTRASMNFPVSDAFQIGINPRGTDFYGVVSLMEGHNLARVLAQPTLVVESGKSAQFLAGGEVPVPVAGEDNKVTVEWKKFGVILEFTPTLLEDGQIALVLKQEVSDIDWNNGISYGSIVIPGFRTRNTNTNIKLRDGESFVISGLLLDEMRNSVTKVPWLGDIPILGALFRSSSYQKNQTELAVVVTPKIVNPIAAGQNIVLPGEKLASPSTFDALLLGELVDTTNPKVGTALLGTGGLEMP